jgi:hypothetical protein
VLVPFGAITENDDDDNNRSLSWPFSSVKPPTTTPTPTTTTSKTSSSSSTTAAVNSTATTEYSSLSTLIPFPQVVSGAQFYVDQHISHGQFGRGSSMPSLVYDPNVLTS